MAALSSFVVRSLVKELSVLQNARLQKISEPTSGLFKLSFAGGKDLLVQPGGRLNLTQYRLVAPQKPSQAVFVLRKHLAGKTLRSITQHNFDRIVVLDFGAATLIVELFADGNMIITDASGSIIWVQTRGEWSSRKLSAGELYKFPDNRPDPVQFDEQQFRESLNERTVASSVSKHLLLGKHFVEEICLDAGVSASSRPAGELVVKLFAAWKMLLERQPNPAIQGGEVVPFPLRSLADKPVFYSSLSEAIDEAYKEELTSAEVGLDKVSQLERRLKQQEEALSVFEADANRFRLAGDKIYKNWGSINEIIVSARSKNYQKLSLLGATRSGFCVTVEL
ncbi:NFACT family protein [archaeon]|nr:NFACT family protein [archaeon]